MTFCKRVSHILLAFAVMSLGVFSFSLPSSALASPSVDVSPFFFSMPMLPDGYFDGDILASDSGYSISLDFSNLSSSGSSYATAEGDVSLTSESQGMDRWTITIPPSFENYSFTGSYSGQSSYDSNGVEYSGGDFSFTGGTQSGTSSTASAVQTADGDEYITGYGDNYSISGSSDFSGTVSGSITSNSDNTDHKRYRCFSVAWQNVLTYFVFDARNVISASIIGDSDPFYYRVLSSGNYPSFRIRFNLNGSVSQASVIPASYSVPFRTPQGTPGNSSWGLWLSPSAPIPSSVSVPAGFTIFREAVFGKESLLFSYLHSLESDLTTIHSDLVSLQSSISNSINNQTNTLVNTNTAGNFDPSSVSNMLNYGSLESNFHAPSTDQIFSTSGGTFADGMTWWRDRMNETLFYSGSPITGLATFTLTLGLAALVIGRRVSGGGTA